MSLNLLADLSVGFRQEKDHLNFKIGKVEVRLYLNPIFA
jgi:hypothetical protein